MDSASIEFVVFGLIVAFLCNMRDSAKWRKAVVLLASLIFVGLLFPSLPAVSPLLAFVVIGYGCVVLLERGSTRYLPAVLVVLITLYAWLKKYTFLPSFSLLHFSYSTLGLSYVFFRVLHLAIEAKDSNVEQRMSVTDYLLYTLNFTTFVSGPIQRYDEYARDQFSDDPPALGWAVILAQVERIVLGFFKVNALAFLLQVVKSNALAELHQPLPLAFKLSAAFRLAVVYPLFLYANFSGYIDIVIAIARLMRIRLPENFDRPFSASSFLDFWNRWHITLSTWLKTYVYNPLLVALMRRNTLPAVEPFLGVVCFFVTFFLVGIWHGRTSEFIVFGILQGGGVAINKLWQVGLIRALGRSGYKKIAQRPDYVILGRGLTFTWFAFTLFWFWASWKDLREVASSLSVAGWLGVWLAVLASSTVVLGIWEWLRARLLSVTINSESLLLHRYARVIYASALALATFIVAFLMNQPAPDIVYKTF